MTTEQPVPGRNGEAAVAGQAAMLPATGTDAQAIALRGVRVHNLKSINVDIPLNCLTVMTGVSGSGKSSLAFDTLYAEGQRRYVETFASAARQHLDTLEKPDAESIGQIPPAIALRQNSVSRTRQSTVSTVTEINDLLRALLARVGTVVCPCCGCEVVPQSPATAVDWLSDLPGGVRFQLVFPVSFDVVEDSGTTLQQLATSGYSRAILVHEEAAAAGAPVNSPRRSAAPNVGENVSFDQVNSTDVATSATELLVIVDRLAAGRAAVERLAESVEACFRDGNGRCVVLTQIESPADTADTAAGTTRPIEIDGQVWHRQTFSRRRECSGCGTLFAEPEGSLLSFRSPHGACPDCAGSGTVDDQTCSTCDGSRLSREARAVRLRCSATGDPAASGAPSDWPGLADLERCPVNDLLERLTSLSESTAGEDQSPTRHLYEAMLPRLRCLSDAGLDYIELNRAMSDLSRGEAQRVALTAILSSQLVNSLFVLDEPSSGLHAADLSRVVNLTLRLRDQGNTVVIVEHELDVARAADHVIEIGPGSGASGGQVVFSGPLDELLRQPGSATAACFRKRRNYAADDDQQPPELRPVGTIKLTGCQHHTLQNVSVEFPLGCLCVVTGVSGSGKTSLVEQTLYPALQSRLEAESSAGIEPSPQPATTSQYCGEFDELRIDGSLASVQLVDDRPLIASRRSSPVTWLKILGEIRSLFADMPDARNRNLTAAHFSFNTDAGGRCPKCAGTGFVTIDMQFMADVTMTCPDCHGTRFLPHIQDVRWRNRSIADVLAMTVDEAFAFFRGERRIQKKLIALRDVGLGYLPLGQPLSTLSGGEAQRLKLAGHLASTTGIGSLLILNEPTTGLHPADVARLLDCFRRLLATGHSLIVIEHQLDVILAADHLIDLGPGAGPAGGRIVATGPLDQILAAPGSRTGQWLKRSLALR